VITVSNLEKKVLGKDVLIDTNIVIYLTDTVSPYDVMSRRLFEMVEAGEVQAFISIISISEVTQGPLKKGFYTAAAEVKDYLLNFPNLQCVDTTKEVLEFTGKDERINWSSLRTVDSLIIASALKSEADKIISNDMHFKRALPQNMIIAFD
jgi:predicted nucleic acid-binding protein